MRYSWWIIVVVAIVLIFGAGCSCIDVYPKEIISSVSSDVNGNTFIAYRLERSVGDHDVHLQKIDPGGAVLWGEVLYSGDNSRVGDVSMVSGYGVLVAWEVYLPEDGGEGPHYFDHATLASVDDEGNVRWQQDFAEEGIQMVGDGGGGVVMAWEDGLGCHAHCVDSGGEVLWEEKIGSGGTGLKLVTGGNGEFFILWDNYDNHCFMVQKVGADGQLLWPEEGVVVEYLEEAFQLEPQMVSDGMGGAIIAWVELTSDQPANDLWLERISADGQDSSRSAIKGPLETMTPNMRVVGDEPLGIIVVWEGIGDGIELRLMRNNPLSSYFWPPEGVSICSGLHKSPRFNVISDGKGGVVVVWIDGDRNLYAQRLDSVGEKLWGDEGVLITHGACELSVWVVGDGYRGFVVGWTSGFTTYHPNDSYLQKIDTNGNLLWGEDGIRLNP